MIRLFRNSPLPAVRLSPKNIPNISTIPIKTRVLCRTFSRIRPLSAEWGICPSHIALHWGQLWICCSTAETLSPAATPSWTRGIRSIQISQVIWIMAKALLF